EGTILVFGIRYVNLDDGRPWNPSKVWTYAGLKAGGRWYLTGTGRVPQDAGWGAVARWLDEPNREVVSVKVASGWDQLYPPQKEPNRKDQDRGQEDSPDRGCAGQDRHQRSGSGSRPGR